MNNDLEAFLKKVNLDIVSYETTKTLKTVDVEYAQKALDAVKNETWDKSLNIAQTFEQELENKKQDLEVFITQNKEAEEMKKYYAEYQEHEKKLKALLAKEPANDREKSRNEFSIEELKNRQNFIIKRLKSLTKNRSRFNTDDLENKKDQEKENKANSISNTDDNEITENKEKNNENQNETKQDEAKQDEEKQDEEKENQEERENEVEENNQKKETSTGTATKPEEQKKDNTLKPEKKSPKKIGVAGPTLNSKMNSKTVAAIVALGAITAALVIANPVFAVAPLAGIAYKHYSSGKKL